MSDKVHVSFIGAGNVAWHLAHALIGQVAIDYIYSRSGVSASILAKELKREFTTDSKDLLKSDVIIIAVPDSKIASVVQELEKHQTGTTIFLHTSGATPAKVLAPIGNNYGVFYPLQTFTKGVHVPMEDVPICMSANVDADRKHIKDLASLISKKVLVMNDEDRLKLHLAAVIANNFTNHLLLQSERFLNNSEIDYELLIPLINETLRKAEKTGPYNAQTGPARRRDLATMQSHLELLKDHVALADLYYLFSNLIINTYENRS